MNLYSFLVTSIISVGSLSIAALSLWWSRKAAFREALHAKQFELCLEMIHRLAAKHKEMVELLLTGHGTDFESVRASVYQIAMQIRSYSYEWMVFVPPAVCDPLMAHLDAIRELEEAGSTSEMSECMAKAHRALGDMAGVARVSLCVPRLTQDYQRMLVGKALPMTREE